MTIYVDLDNTLCITNGEDYANSHPIASRIAKINSMYNDNLIVIYTARGSGSGKDYRSLTEAQLKKWGLNYHHLSIGEKPVFDMLIDDRSVHPDNFFTHE